MPFQFKRLEIPEVVLIEPKVFQDQRGFFIEAYKHSDFLKFGIVLHFVQDNHSKSIVKGVIRGLHFQKKSMAQAKLIRVLAGSIFDVAVDIRKNSPTYSKWISVMLSAENKSVLYIPEGFAHGFCTLQDNTEIVYKCTNEYSVEHDRGIIWNDLTINIDWPVKNPILSKRDNSWPHLFEAESDFIYG